MQDKRVRLTVEFRVSFRDITPETLAEVYAGGVVGLEEMRSDPAWQADMGRQRRVLQALLRDEEALRRFVACAVVGEIGSCEGERLRKALGVGRDEEALWPVIEALGGRDAKFYAAVRGEGKLRDYIELIFYSTPVEIVEARMEEVGEEVSGESDKSYVIPP